MGGEDDEEVDSDAPSPRDSAHSVDDLLDLLRNPTRRSVLDHLRETPGHSSTTGELTAFLLEQSPDVERSHQEVGASLEHTHLPKLAEAGLVEYEPRNGDVRYHPEAQLEALFDRILEFEHSE